MINHVFISAMLVCGIVRETRTGKQGEKQTCLIQTLLFTIWFLKSYWKQIKVIKKFQSSDTWWQNQKCPDYPNQTQKFKYHFKDRPIDLIIQRQLNFKNVFKGTGHIRFVNLNLITDSRLDIR